MARFSASDAALEGVNLMRRRWRVVLGWAGFNLLALVMLAVIFYVMVWLLISIIGAALIGVAGGAEALDNIKGLTGPAIIGVALYVFLQLILQVIQVVMLYAPFAVAYQQVHGDPPANPLRVRPQDS